MADLNALALDFLRCLPRVLRSVKMYKGTHPQVMRDADATWAPLASMLAIEDPVVIGVSEGILVVQGKAVKTKAGTLDTFSEILREKRLASLKATRAANRDELLEVVRILVMKPKDALQDEKLKPELHAMLKGFKLVELQFGMMHGEGTVVALTDGALEAAKVLADAGVKSREDALQVVDGLFKSLKAQPTPDGVAQFFDKAKDDLAALDEETAATKARECLEQVAAEAMASKGVDGLKDSMMKTVMAMPQEMRKLVFGEEVSDGATLDVFRLLRKLDPKVRSSALVTDLVSGKLGAEDLQKAMEVMGPSPDEFVKLYESVFSQLCESQAEAGSISEAMSRLFKTLKAQGKVQVIKAIGTLLVLDPVEIVPGGYASDLEEMGFTVVRQGNGRKAFELLGARGDVQCLVLDIKVPGMSGLEILNGLQEKRIAVPVIVVTERRGFEDAFEVASYPKLKYLTKPVDLNELRAAISEFVPQPRRRDGAGESPAPGELQRAQKIQEKLIPTESPKVEGYDLAFYYKPALAVGGDYIDFIPLAGGRVGVVVADVSGKNVTGAMVMVMFRSVFRMMAPRMKGARETIIEVNKCVTKDIPRGMFVSAVYGVLDPVPHTITVANAGHNPPLVWTKDFGMASFLTIGGTALGLFATTNYENSIREDVIQLAPQDRILMYTDGVVEAMDGKGNEFTEKRFLKLVNVNSEKTGSDLVKGLVGDIERHRGAAEQSDDITILCLSRGAQAAAPGPPDPAA